MIKKIEKKFFLYLVCVPYMPLRLTVNIFFTVFSFYTLHVETLSKRDEKKNELRRHFYVNIIRFLFHVLVSLLKKKKKWNKMNGDGDQQVKGNAKLKT